MSRKRAYEGMSMPDDLASMFPMNSMTHMGLGSSSQYSAFLPEQAQQRQSLAPHSASQSLPKVEGNNGYMMYSSPPNPIATSTPSRPSILPANVPVSANVPVFLGGEGRSNPSPSQDSASSPHNSASSPQPGPSSASTPPNLKVEPGTSGMTSPSGSDESSQSKSKKQKTVPDHEKDEAYYEKRRKNNESAKRSREARRIKEVHISQQVVILEQKILRMRTRLDLVLTDNQRILRRIEEERRDQQLRFGSILQAYETEDPSMSYEQPAIAHQNHHLQPPPPPPNPGDYMPQM